MPGPCQVRESETCLRGGGPPRCPGIVNAPGGTSCNDANICTTGDVCTAGVCGGGPLVCESPTDTCEPSSGCATDCGPAGCVVSAFGDGDPTLTIPPDALIADVRISMDDLGNDPNDPSVFHVYDLGPDGTQFAIPATLYLPAPPLGPGQIAAVEVADAITGPWVGIPTTLSAGRVSGDISHFSACRTRAIAPPLTLGLQMVDMVDFKDVVISDGLVVPGCDPAGSPQGVCFTFRNPGPVAVTSAIARVFLWQCYNRIFDYTDPVTGEHEGQHCDKTGIIIPCPNPEDVQLMFPPPGLLPGAEATAKYDIPPSPVAVMAVRTSASM